jgi:hypothetical protein
MIQSNVTQLGPIQTYTTAISANPLPVFIVAATPPELVNLMAEVWKAIPIGLAVGAPPKRSAMIWQAKPEIMELTIKLLDVYTMCCLHRNIAVTR